MTTSHDARAIAGAGSTDVCRLSLERHPLPHGRRVAFAIVDVVSRKQIETVVSIENVDPGTRTWNRQRCGRPALLPRPARPSADDNGSGADADRRWRTPAAAR